MNEDPNEASWAEIASAWLPFLRGLGDDVERMVWGRWTSDGVGRSGPPELYDRHGNPLPLPPARNESGERSDLDRLRARVTMRSGRRLGDLHRAAASAGQSPPPNWFRMTLWRDGRYRASFTFDAEQEARFALGETEYTKSDAVSDEPTPRPSDEEREREERELRAESREMARANLENLFLHPDDPKWLERFLHAHAGATAPRPWEEVRVGLRLTDDGSTRVFQEARREGETDFEPLELAEPLWVIDALEHTRRIHGEDDGERRRDLTAHLTRDALRLVWGEAP